MSAILFEEVGFHYDDPYSPVFAKLNLNINTEWKTAVVGNNGRGKTTLLRLVHGALQPVEGSVHRSVETFYFPYRPAGGNGPAFEVVKECVGPYKEWERNMEQYLQRGDEESLAKYGDLLERFQAMGGYSIDAAIERECAELGINREMLQRPFNTFSGGEQTRALIVALFLRKDMFPLIDEPTNHLDMEGREMLAEYLRRKPGFLLVSHDRAFLDHCADHVLSINRSDVRIISGNYSDWKREAEIEEERELRMNEKLTREIKELEKTAEQRRKWSSAVEKEKRGAYDKGYLGHKSARMMKRALHVERRIQWMIEEKKELLHNLEQRGRLHLPTGERSPELVVSVTDATVALNEVPILRNVSLTVRRGERVALTGPNGSGKSTLLRTVAGELRAAKGLVSVPSRLRTARAYQEPLLQRGSLRDSLHAMKIDETRFRQIMGAFGLWGDIFERPLETFSRGELKKVDLCRSFLEPADLLIWDEPMNYIDAASREQIEEVILESGPTMLFVEHDRRFLERVATEIHPMSGLMSNIE